MQSHPWDFSSNSVEDLNPPFEEAQRFPAKPTHFQAAKRSRSPPLPANEVHWRNIDVDRAFASPPRIGDTTNSFAKNANSTTQQRSSSFSPILDAKGSGAKITNSQVAKRTRSPPVSYDDVLYGDDVDPGTSYFSRDDTEREVQAKAKRLARFNVELSQPAQSSLDQLKHKFQGNRHDTMEERQKVGAKQPIEETGDLMLPDNEGLEPSTVIIGLCPDMCPESERAERGRKGDLDKYERLDGDRNQTTRFLAVKKYTRTAEREADLIRPMPVLRNTIDYLLNLLDQPYDERFLAMYNFLWDRMRAIRMDLRMQHIFDHDAITMLEQMIRLHIIAMHELCEYTKGEGFSEGFDAHLNIEQMNKTSVELFQMYDDHRKKGRIVPSEKEFRGYYALLKLDKHPGYKVEPAELSLDLAKMTPEIRQTPEILFAREVARACRTGNFIAFFRLARKATYLQACLMHAHFAKLRTQALASLHSGLQNNQGIPISHITKWLGMEEEDIENLLEYHGFLIKEFEESYMVKEGPFLNSDKDYRTKCSLLVHLKKSRRIVEDVSSSDPLGSPAEQSKQVVLDKVGKLNSKAIPVVKPKALVCAVDEEMLDHGEDHTPMHDSQVKPVLEISSITDQMIGSVPQVSQAWDITPIHHSPHFTLAKVGIVSKPAQMTSRNNSLERNLHLNLKEMPLQSMIGRAPEVEGAVASSNECQVESPAPERLATGSPETDEVMVAHPVVEDEAVVALHEEIENEEDFTAQEEKEIAAAKLKLIIRTWRRHSLKRRELRELRQLAANAALASLSFGLPIQQMNAQPSHVSELDIDWTVRERHEKRRRSWSRLNISEAVSEILSERYTYSKCLCWKLIVCSGTNDTGGDRLRQMSQSDHLASLWLHSKLLGVGKEKDDELVVSYTGLSIWKKWVTSKYQSFPTCCLSVIREAKFDELDNTLGGTDAVVFLISESISLEFQKDRLCRLLMSLPEGSPVPLLILSCTFKEQIANPSSIANRLGLHFMDQKKISRFSVISLVKDQQSDKLDGFFSSDCLVEGIQWLASQSPLHPVLHCTKTHELVMDHLGSSWDVLEKIDVSVVGPNHCISAFNNALDESAEEVVTAANTNAASWPCPEINLLEEFSDEFRAVKKYMPVVGWSSATNIEPILKRFQGCKLPFFPDDLSWLNNGSDTGEEILNQKSELQKCLIRYLTLSSKMMDVALATTEACVMLQKGAILELQGSNYHIKPRWVAIFRRIFNWQLTNLTSGAPSVAYVLEQPSVVESHNIVIPSNSCMREFNLSIASSSLKGTDRLKFNAASPAYTFAQPSLDEMIAVCCNTQQSGREQSETRAIRPLSGIAGNANQVLDVAMTTDIVDDNEKFWQGVSIQTRDALSPSHLSEGMVVANKGKKEADKLSQLLEQCNMLQDTIDEKLSIYF